MLFYCHKIHHQVSVINIFQSLRYIIAKKQLWDYCIAVRSTTAFCFTSIALIMLFSADNGQGKSYNNYCTIVHYRILKTRWDIGRVNIRCTFTTYFVAKRSVIANFTNPVFSFSLILSDWKANMLSVMVKLQSCSRQKATSTMVRDNQLRADVVLPAVGRALYLLNVHSQE